MRRVGGVMRWIRDLGEPEFDKLLDNIKYLCWGEDELSVRFDQLFLTAKVLVRSRATRA